MEGEPDISDLTSNNIGTTHTDGEAAAELKTDTLEKKALHLKLMLEKDLYAADLKWSLFVAAAHSFRHDSILKPFPPAFFKNGIKDLDELLCVVRDVPPLELLKKQLDDLNKLSTIASVIDLLFFLLVRLREPSLKYLNPDEHEKVLSRVDSKGDVCKPQHIFQVISSNKNQAENKWLDLSKGHKTFFAYHGTKLENFHSILHFGLHAHMNKNMLFGAGTYLSSELGVSLPYSHSGFGWGASCIAGQFSCVALCEIIDAPEGINYQKHNKSEGDATEKRFENNSQVPLAYYVVSNNDLIRVRYLLVYCKSYTKSHGNSVDNVQGGITQWLARHKLASILLGYGLMLATIGLANNQPLQLYYKSFLRKLELMLTNIK